jgi:hypothetical protein
MSRAALPESSLVAPDLQASRARSDRQELIGTRARLEDENGKCNMESMWVGTEMLPVLVTGH